MTELLKRLLAGIGDGNARKCTRTHGPASDQDQAGSARGARTIQNGSHYRRDVTLGEDASQISGRNAAQAMATLRNLVLGLFELQKDQEKANAPNVPGWRRKMTASAALRLITKGA